MFVKEDGEIRYVTEALENRIEITGISEIREPDLSFLRAFRTHLVPVNT